MTGDEYTAYLSKRIIVGTTIVTANGNYQVKLFTKAQFKAIAGRYFDYSKDFITVMNADFHDSMAVHVSGAGYASTEGNIYALYEGTRNGNLRINYLIILGG